MTEIVILTEEPSIEPVIEHLLPQLDLHGATVRIIPHQGAPDLEKSLPRKLRGWRNPHARFLVIRDNDSGDCVGRKQRLQEIVSGAGRGTQTRIRIVCQELEAWFLGDRAALDGAGVLPESANPAAIRGDVDKINQSIS